MTVPNGVSDATNDGSATLAETKPNDQTSVSDDQGKQINPADHKRAVDDMLKYKGQVKDLRDQLDSMNATIADMKKASLAEKEDYKALYEAEVEAHNATKKRVHDLESIFYETQKYNAVYPKLLEAGLRQDAKKILDNYDFSLLEVETTSEGRVFVNGVDTFIDQFKSDYPFAFELKKAPNINSGGISPSAPRDSGPMTGAKLFEIEKKHGRDSPEYKAGFDKLVEQKRQQA